MTKARDLANASTALSAVSATELAFVDGVTSAIQTQMDAKAPSSTAVTLTGTQTLTNKTLTSPVIASVVNNTLTSTTGDIIYASAANTPARLGIGSSAQVLTVASGVPSWATPASGGGMTLLATTTFTGATVTVSSLSGYKQLVFVLRNVYVATNGYVYVRFNGDSGNNYSSLRLKAHDTNITATAYGAGVGSGFAFNIGDSATATNKLGGVITVYAADQTSGSSYVSSTGFNDGTGNTMTFVNGRYFNSAVISSITLGDNGGAFSGGTLMTYGVN